MREVRETGGGEIRVKELREVRGKEGKRFREM